MNIQIILNEGMKTCCKTYSPDYIRKTVQSWMTDADCLEIIDIKETNYELEELAPYAKTFFEDNLFQRCDLQGGNGKRSGCCSIITKPRIPAPAIRP